MNGIVRYFQEARLELLRVTWPTRQQVLEGTQAVLIFVIALTLITFLYDKVFQVLVKLVLP
ncbi:preprotein translocase subunit SecE [Deinococcus maricopensis]|uniref:Protein translocase subunit SecE n=1 Tax=Deinococcus maricopensis (strain DSM 21211 / LMG 22137 / NRRL B-23946 / LB-34) TaxID=709986 RepID=E8U5Z3_DEIML|nr:preprotein translocase subunit SecE [Deinococcus maricopensis]ADV66482.1 preprotein translocase, SecE subunit [Deinococcus maricopensis DSM 21211]